MFSGTRSDDVRSCTMCRFGKTHTVQSCAMCAPQEHGGQVCIRMLSRVQFPCPSAFGKLCKLCGKTQGPCTPKAPPIDKKTLWPHRPRICARHQGTSSCLFQDRLHLSLLLLGTRYQACIEHQQQCPGHCLLWVKSFQHDQECQCLIPSRPSRPPSTAPGPRASRVRPDTVQAT
jgi:hypothetical protein